MVIISEADKLFKKLGFKKDDLEYFGVEKWGETFYNKNTFEEIIFDIEDKEITFINREEGESVYLGVDEMKAIYKKMQELRWI